MPQHPGVWQPANRTTIDATTPDAALENARSGYPTAGAHSNIGQAVNNILSGFVAFGRKGQFIGHGLPGLIIVGGGSSAKGPNTYIGLGNSSTWVPVLESLKNEVVALRLLGCRVGAKQAGADLLRLVACAIGAPVIAPTGLALTAPNEKIALQDGSVWQIGQCSVEARVIPMPYAPDPSRAPLVLLSADGEREYVPLAQVSRVEFIRGEFFGRGRLALEGDEARELVLKARLFDPNEASRPLLAVPTGELTLFYNVKGQEHSRQFVLLADAVLQDKELPAVTYEVTQEFAEELPEYDLRRPGPRD
jgi:hypothetical protein